MGNKRNSEDKRGFEEGEFATKLHFSCNKVMLDKTISSINMLNSLNESIAKINEVCSKSAIGQLGNVEWF